MPYCRKCGAEISDHQFKKFNKTCPNCIRVIEAFRTHKMYKERAKIKLKERRFLIILGIVLLGITGFGTAIVMGIHYWYISSYINHDLPFGAFFIANFFPDVLLGFFVGVFLIIVIVIIAIASD